MDKLSNRIILESIVAPGLIASPNMNASSKRENNGKQVHFKKRETQNYPSMLPAIPPGKIAGISLFKGSLNKSKNFMGIDHIVLPIIFFHTR